MNVLEFLGIKKPTVLNQYQSPVNTNSVPMASNVVPMVKQPVVLPNAPKAAVTSQVGVNNYKVYDPQNPNYERNQAIGKSLLGFGKGLLSTGYYDSPLAAGLSGAVDGYGEARGTSDERVARAELEAAYKTNDQGKIALARSKYQALPNYNKDVLAGLEVARNESISGVKQETGYVYNPATGKSEYRDPNGGIQYQADKVTKVGAATTEVQVDATTKIGEAQTNVDAKKQRAVGDIEVEQALKKSKGMSDQAFEEWKIKNKTEFDQQIEAQRAALQGQVDAANAKTPEYSAQERNTAQTIIQKEEPTLNKLNIIKKVNVPVVDSLVAELKALDPSNLSKTLGSYSSGIFQSDTNDIYGQLDAALNSQILASLPPGAASNADMQRAADAFNNRTLSVSAFIASWERAKLALAEDAAFYENRVAEAKDILEGSRGGNSQGTSTTSTSTSTTTTGNQPAQSDSGGNTSVSGSSW